MFGWVKRKPDELVGGGYMLRWHLIPRNRFFNIYLHNIKRSDRGLSLHDHPWWSMSIILRGAYREILVGSSKIRRAGSFILRRPETFHRLEAIDWGDIWTLFITGPRIREWGFMSPNGWVRWDRFNEKGR